MGSRGQKSGLVVRQITLDDVSTRNAITYTIRENAKKRKQMSESGGGGGRGQPGLFVKCVCCGEYTIPVNTEYEKCPNCDWIDDKFQNTHPDSTEGQNTISLNDAKRAFNNKTDA